MGFQISIEVRFILPPQCRLTPNRSWDPACNMNLSLPAALPRATGWKFELKKMTEAVLHVFHCLKWGLVYKFQTHFTSVAQRHGKGEVLRNRTAGRQPFHNVMQQLKVANCYIIHCCPNSHIDLVRWSWIKQHEALCSPGSGASGVLSFAVTGLRSRCSYKMGWDSLTRKKV